MASPFLLVSVVPGSTIVSPISDSGRTFPSRSKQNSHTPPRSIRHDLSAAQRQSLMRTLGKMHAVQTWDKVVAILENEDENAENGEESAQNA